MPLPQHTTIGAREPDIQVLHYGHQEFQRPSASGAGWEYANYGLSSTIRNKLLVGILPTLYFIDFSATLKVDLLHYSSI